MKKHTVIRKGHFKQYDSLIPGFRIVGICILAGLIFFLNWPNIWQWNMLYVLSYFVYAWILFLNKKLRQFIVYKNPLIIGICESLMIAYGISVTGGENSFLYYSYLMILIFYGTIHSGVELIAITSYIMVSYVSASWFSDHVITIAIFPRVLYLIFISAFIGFLNSRIKNYNYEIAVKDSLTGLFNRQYLFAELDNLIQESRQNRNTFAILVIDVNDFKRINDTFGHIEGDRILKEISDMLKQTLSSEHVIARYGGDEFIVVIPKADDTKAKMVQGTLYEKMSELFSGKVSLAIGRAIFPQDGMIAETLFHNADLNMYEEKSRIKAI